MQTGTSGTWLVFEAELGGPAWSTFRMDLFRCSTIFLALMILFSAITTSKGNVACISLLLYAYSLTQYRTFVKPLRDFVIIYLMAEIDTGTPDVIGGREVPSGITFANFEPHKFSYLNIASLGSDYVFDGEECGFACVSLPSCFSYNLAALYDINERILCELLPSDKYNNSDKFVSSRSFHHFSIVVSSSMTVSLKYILITVFFFFVN